MSIEPERDQFFQYATFGVIGVTLVICLCYGLLFLQPRLNPVGAMQPATPTVAVAVFQLPPTWTPTVTQSPTPTDTAAPTDTPTNTPTNTPVATDTPPPTATSIPTRVPPTVRPSPYPTRPPAPPPPPPPSPTAASQAHFIAIKNVAGKNCSTWNLHGTIWANGYGNGFVPGTRVALWVNGAIAKLVTAGSGSFGNVSPGYWEMDFASNSAGNGFVGIVDNNGNQLSPQYTVHLTSSCKSSDAVTVITMDFTRQ